MPLPSHVRLHRVFCLLLFSFLTFFFFLLFECHTTVWIGSFQIEKLHLKDANIMS